MARTKISPQAKGKATNEKADLVAETGTRRRIINESALIASQAGEVRQPTESGERVTVMIPKNFSLTLEDHSQVHYKAGVDEMPVEHAEHWYTKAMGVEIHDPKKQRD
jgi:hypothetical protein